MPEIEYGAASHSYDSVREPAAVLREKRGPDPHGIRTADTARPHPTLLGAPAPGHPCPPIAPAVRPAGPPPARPPGRPGRDHRNPGGGVDVSGGSYDPPMSMIGEYARLTAEEFARALEDPQWAQERVGELVEAELGGGPGGAEARCLDTDKAWHALDFLLSRIGFPVDVVFGEGAIPGAEDWGYTPPRYLTPARVRVAAEALRDTPVERLVEGVGPETWRGRRCTR